MTENENPTAAEPLDSPAGGVGTATPPPPRPPLPPARPPLRRSRTDRVFAGVCGGLGRYFDVDPVLIRILVVVLTVFTGGAFLIAYVLGWVLIADEPAYVAVPMPAGTGTPPGAPVSYASGGTGTFVDPGTGQVYGSGQYPVYASPQPAVRTEPRSYLGVITLCASLVVGGLLWVLGLSGVSVPGVVVAAAMLAVLGVGLLVGAFRGRARWLIVPAIILLLCAQAAAVVPRVVGSTAGSGIGDRRWVPTTSGQSFELGAGDATLDLRSMPAAGGDVDVSVGVGQLTVLVPADTTLVLQAEVGLGDVSVPGHPSQQGSGLDVSTSLDAVAGTSSPTTVHVDAQIGLGSLEVRRAAS